MQTVPQPASRVLCIPRAIKVSGIKEFAVDGYLWGSKYIRMSDYSGDALHDFLISTHALNRQ